MCRSKTLTCVMYSLVLIGCALGLKATIADSSALSESQLAPVLLLLSTGLLVPDRRQLRQHFQKYVLGVRAQRVVQLFATPERLVIRLCRDSWRQRIFVAAVDSPCSPLSAR